MISQRIFKTLLFPILSIFVYPLLGFEGIISTASLLAVFGSLYFSRNIQTYFSWIFIFLSILEIISLSHWIILLPLGIITPFESIALFEAKLSSLITTIIPYIITMIISSFLLRPLIGFNEKTRSLSYFSLERFDKLISKKIIIIFSIIVLSMISAIYPTFFNINPYGYDVGVDAQIYIQKAKLYENEPILFFKVDDRPFFYFTVHIFQILFSLKTQIVLKYVPVLLHPLLALSAFFFTSECFKNKWIPPLASFFTIFGYKISVGMYSYFLANILALSFTYFSLGLIFKSINKKNYHYLILSILFVPLIFFTHPWTFYQFICPIFLTFVIARANTLGNRFFKIFLVLIVCLSGLVIYLNFYIFRGFGYNDAIFLILTNISSISIYWNDIFNSFILLYGGLLSNVILLILAFMGIIKLNLRKLPELYLWSLGTLTTLFFLIGNVTIKSRLFFNLPIGIYAVLGLYAILQSMKNKELKINFVVFVLLNMIVYTFRGLSNLV